MVGAGGFEPPTFWSRTKRATSLRYTPIGVDYRGQNLNSSREEPFS